MISPVILEEESTSLCCVPSMEEVFFALTSILSNNTPGLDGFGSGFFKSCWEVVKFDVLEAISKFLISK